VPAELYGPFGALAALTFVVLAMIRGDLVPGFIYRAEVTQRMKAETEASQNAVALTALARAASSGINGGTNRG
jgi:hypothetical protein